jgi:hypothetical protein
MDMTRILNPSTTVLAYGYDPESQELHVQFKGYHRKRDGADIPATTYAYSGVPAHVYEGLVKADEDPDAHLGNYHRVHVVGGGYPTRKL